MCKNKHICNIYTVHVYSIYIYNLTLLFLSKPDVLHEFKNIYTVKSFRNGAWVSSKYLPCSIDLKSACSVSRVCLLSEFRFWWMSRKTGVMDSGPCTQHYTMLIIPTLFWGGGGDDESEMRRRTQMKKKGGRRGSGSNEGGLESHK